MLRWTRAKAGGGEASRKPQAATGGRQGFVRCGLCCREEAFGHALQVSSKPSTRSLGCVRTPCVQPWPGGIVWTCDRVNSNRRILFYVSLRYWPQPIICASIAFRNSPRAASTSAFRVCSEASCAFRKSTLFIIVGDEYDKTSASRRRTKITRQARGELLVSIRPSVSQERLHAAAPHKLHKKRTRGDT